MSAQGQQLAMACGAALALQIHGPYATEIGKRSQIMIRLLLAGVAVCLLAGIASAQSPPGTATQIGEKIDRGLSQIGAGISQAWGEVRQSVEKMGVQGRMYGRLHWDKALEGATLEINVRD